jgi:hypothetical protein
MAQRVRCKFKLQNVTKKLGQRAVYDKDDPKKHIGYEECYFWDAQFMAVTGGTGDDNQKFWTYTPSGTLTLTTVNELPWEIGKEYYLDLIPATPDA